MPGLMNKPVEEQSKMLQDGERWLTRWFERKREVTQLEESESDLALMFRVVDGQLIMVPVTLTEVNDTEYINRAFIDQGVNVTVMATKIPLYTLLPVLLEGDTSPAAKLRMQQIFIATLREAAHHPDARLDTVEDAVYDENPLLLEHTQEATPEAPSVDALGEVDYEIEFTVIPVNTKYGDRYELSPQDEFLKLPEFQKRQVLFDAGLAMDQLVTEQQF